jgi:hypothetical protein
MKNWHFGLYASDHDDEYHDYSESGVLAKIAKAHSERERHYLLKENERRREARKKLKTPADPNVVIKTCENCGGKQRSHINNRLIKCKRCVDN